MFSAGYAEIMAFVIFFAACFLLSASLCVVAHFRRRKLRRLSLRGTDGVLLPEKDSVLSADSCRQTMLLANDSNGVRGKFSQPANGVKKSSTLTDLVKLPVIQEDFEESDVA